MKKLIKAKKLRLCVLMLVTIGTFMACTGENAANIGELGEVELGEVEQLTTVCGSTCPSGSHPTQYSCNYSCGSSCYGPGNSNRVTCEPNSGTFTQCGSSCPSGWNPTQYSCNYYSCGSPCYGPGNSNQVTCAPPCDPRAGTHGQIWINTSANSDYVYHDGWCSVGTQLPAMCWEGTYYYQQSLVSQYCMSVGSGGSCYNPDAWWNVTCRSLVDCIYNCSGQCVKADC